MTKWQKVKLSEIADISSGLWKAKGLDTSSVSIIRNANFTKGCGFDATDISVIEVDNSQLKSRILKYGDIIVEKSGGGPGQPVGRVLFFNINDTNYTFSNFTSRLRIIKDKEVNCEYVYRYLQYFYLSGRTEKLQSNSIGIRNLKISAFMEQKIPLPPKEEQERIAKELDAVSDLLAKQKQLLTEQDTLIKATFYDMFGKYFEIGNTYKLLPDICKFIDYRGKTPEKADSGILLITAKNVRPNLFQSEPQEYISEDTYDARMTRGFPQINDVMFTTEAPLGYVCRIPRLNGKFSVGQRIIVMHPYSEITSEYLEYALSSDSFQSEMYKHSSGSTARGIRSAELEKLSIPVPPLPLQQKFAAVVEQIETQKQKIKSAITETETLFDALMAKYFDEE